MENIRPAKVGAGPRWEPVLLAKPTFYGNIALGNASSLKVGMFKTSGGIFIGVEGRGAYEFQNEVQPGYVNEKLGLGNISDAANFSDLINNELGVGSKVEQGSYVFKYCRP